MRAIYVTKFAESGSLAFTTDAPKPQLDPNSSDLLVRVRACALNPGDCKLLSGSVSLVMKPKQFPYIPGIDVCGVVEAVGSKCLPRGKFKVGDRVIGSQELFVHGSFADYVLIKSSQAALAPPESISSDLEAASLPVAGCTAIQAIKDAKVGSGSRVLVVGGSGGVGSLVIQLAKLRGAAFVAATSTNTKLVASLGADVAINYRDANWWDVLKSDKDDQRLDAIIDCVGDEASWHHCDDVLKKWSGKYIAVVDAPDTTVRSVGELFRFLGPMLWRSLNPFTTSYKMVSSFPKTKELEELVAIVSENAAEGRHKLRAVLDASSPYELSLEDAERAVALQMSHRAKGKLVFRVSSS